jgi:hypothetical protein
MHEIATISIAIQMLQTEYRTYSRILEQFTRNSKHKAYLYADKQLERISKELRELQLKFSELNKKNG